MVIADTGTTGHFLREATNNAPLVPATPLHVKLPDGHLISSIGTTSINWTGLPHSPTQAHVTPKLNPHSLILIGILCDHDCTVIFNKHNVTITRKNYCILHGTRLPNGLWSLPLHSTPHNHKPMPPYQPTHKKTLYNGSMLLPSALASVPLSMQLNETSLPHGRTFPPHYLSILTYSHCNYERTPRQTMTMTMKTHCH